MSEKQSLVAIVSRVAEIETLLIEGNGELTDRVLALITQTEVALPQKIENYAQLIERMRSIAQFYKSQSDFILRMAKAADSIADRCSDGIRNAMEVLGTSEIEGQTVRYKLQNTAPRCVITDESKLSDEYFVTERHPDKKAIAKALAAEVAIEGAHLEPSRSLRKYPIKPTTIKAGA